MDGQEFEYFCAELLRANGYDDVEVTPGSGDQGIDVIAYKDGIKFGIQCKCYSSDIGNKAVQEAYSGKEFYGCHIGAVLSNRRFTSSAKDLASRNRILLWDRDYLVGLMKNADSYLENESAEKESGSRNRSEMTEETIDFVLGDDQPASVMGDDKKYDVFLRIDDKQVIKNAGRRNYTAQQLSMSAGMTKSEALSKMFNSPSVLASGISKTEAEKMTRSFHSFGCSVYMEESDGRCQDASEEEGQERKPAAKSNAIAILVMAGLTVLFAALTALCWNKSTDGDLGVLIVAFAFLTVFSGLLLIASVKGYSKES